MSLVRICDAAAPRLCCPVQPQRSKCQLLGTFAAIPHACLPVPNRDPAHPSHLMPQVVAQCSKCQRVFQQQSVPSKCDEEECPAFNLRARPDTPSA